MSRKTPERKDTLDRPPDRHPGRRMEAVTGTMGMLLMVQPLLWPSVVSKHGPAGPGLPGALRVLRKPTGWPSRTVRTARKGARAFQSLLVLIPGSAAFLTARPGDWSDLPRPVLEATRLFTTAASTVSGVSGASSALGGLLGIAGIAATGTGQ